MWRKQNEGEKGELLFCMYLDTPPRKSQRDAAIH